MSWIPVAAAPPLPKSQPISAGTFLLKASAPYPPRYGVRRGRVAAFVWRAFHEKLNCLGSVVLAAE